MCAITSPPTTVLKGNELTVACLMSFAAEEEVNIPASGDTSSSTGMQSATGRSCVSITEDGAHIHKQL
jgi:hypothetical protein